MLVVVSLMHGMAVASVHVVEVAFMGYGLMTAVLAVHVHMGTVREVHGMPDVVAVGQRFDVVRARGVDPAIMEVVDVVLVRHRRMSAPLVVDMLMPVDRDVAVRCGC